MAAGMGAALGLGVVLTMANRLSGPATAASASMQTLSMRTDRATLSQIRMEAAVKAGRVALIGAAGATIALGLVVAEAARFEEGMKRVEAVLVPTTAQLRALSAAAVEAGIKTRWSPRQATEGLKELATAGFKAGEATAALMPVLDLATGSLGQLGVAGAAETAASAVRGFGFEAKDTAKVVDILLRSTQLTNIQARDFKIMMGRVSGAARSASQEFEHTIVLLGAMRNTGLEASASATTIRSALLAMTKVPAKQELDRLGVSIADANGNFRDTAAVIFDLEKKLSKMTEVQRKASIEAVFGARGQNLFNAVTQMGAKRAAQLESELKNASGTAASFRKKVLEPLAGRLVLMAGSVQTLATQLGKPLLGPVKLIVSMFTRFLNISIMLTQWFPRTTKMIMLFVGAVTLLSGLIGVVLLLGVAFVKLNAAIGLVTKAKAAYFFISKMLFGMEGFTRKQLLLSLFAEKLRLTQTTLINARTKIRIILEKILGIGISRNTSITYASVAAAWQKRIATLGNNVALGINNILIKLNTFLKWGNIKATFFHMKATMASSGAMQAAAGATGILTGALKGLRIAIMTNPILLLITLVLLFVVAFTKLSRAFWNAKGSSQALYAALIVLMSPIGLLVVLAKIFHSAWKQNLGGVRTAWVQMKKAIMTIFTPLGRLFTAMKGVGPLGKLFKSVMTIVMIPFALAFNFISKAARFMGSVIETIVQQVERAFVPLSPAVEELSIAFDELSVAIFGRGGANLGFWKSFGTVVRGVIRLVFIPLAKIVGFGAKVITIFAKAIRAVLNPMRHMMSLMREMEGFTLFGTIAKTAMGFARGLFGMQKGGIVRGPTPAMLAEGGRPELVMPLPSGLKPADLKEVFDTIKRGMVPAAGPAAAGPISVVIENRIFLDGKEIQRYSREIDDLDLARSFA